VFRRRIDGGLSGDGGATKEEAGTSIGGTIRDDGEELPALAVLVVEVVGEQPLFLPGDQGFDHRGTGDDELARFGRSVTGLRVDLQIDGLVFPACGHWHDRSRTRAAGRLRSASYVRGRQRNKIEGDRAG